MEMVIFLRDADGSNTQLARVEADGFSCSRAAWNSSQPNQHGTAMKWELDDNRHLVVSMLGVLLIDSSRYTVTAGSMFSNTIFLEAVEPREMPVAEPLFPLGDVVGTPGALEAIRQAGDAPAGFLARHVRGDWGDICADDKVNNHIAIKLGNRILSAYQTTAGVNLWVITEADRHSTTILLPEEY